MSLSGLFGPKWKSRNCKKRKAAVSVLQDQRILAIVAQEDPDIDIRRIAVSRLDDQAILAHIAMEHAEPNTRSYAVEKLEDQTVLARIAANAAEVGYVRQAAILRLNPDLALIEDLALHCDDERVRGAAAKRYVAIQTAISDLGYRELMSWVSGSSGGDKRLMVCRVIMESADYFEPSLAPKAARLLRRLGTEADVERGISLGLLHPNAELDRAINACVDAYDKARRDPIHSGGDSRARVKSRRVFVDALKQLKRADDPLVVRLLFNQFCERFHWNLDHRLIAAALAYFGLALLPEDDGGIGWQKINVRDLRRIATSHPDEAYWLDELDKSTNYR